MADQPRDAARYFDTYEVIGVITPGVVAALLLTIEWPSFRGMLGDRGLSIGDLGLFVLVAFVLGHLLQAVGNALEPVIWFPAGLPTNWTKPTTQRLLTPEQRNALERAVAQMEGKTQDIAKMNRRQWLAITTRVYGRVKKAGRSGRVDIANRAYGLSRGLSAALLVCFAWYAFAHGGDYTALLILGAAVCAALWRMRRAGVQYARVLFLEFIDLSAVAAAMPQFDSQKRRPTEKV